MNAWSCASGFRKNLCAGAVLPKYLRNDEGDGDGGLDLGMDARLLEHPFQEEEGLKGTRNCPYGHGRLDFARKNGELPVNRVSLVE